MTLYMISLGLGNKEDITLRGLNVIKKCDKIFLENYTAIMNCPVSELEELYGKKIELASRDLVEKESDKILDSAKESDVAFLVVGDVFGATTHADLFLRAKEKNVDVEIINNASIMNAIGVTGLELYKFGKTTSIVFDDNDWLPETPYNAIKENKERGLHTLCLLDIKVAEPSPENIKKGINKPEPARFMTIKQAIEILNKLEEKRGEKVISNETLAMGVARLGTKNQIIKSGTLRKLKEFDFGKEMHSLIIPGKLHDIEKEMFNNFN